MMYTIWATIAVVVVFVAVSFAWRYASRRWSLPCPTIFAGAVDGQFVDKFSATTATLDRMGLECSPKCDPCGMRVSSALLGKEILDERQEASSGADHQKAA